MKTFFTPEHRCSPLSSAALLGAVTVLCLCLLHSTPALADETEATGSETEVSLEAGGRYADTDGDRSFIFPYDPLDSNVFFIFDLYNIRPGSRSIEMEAEFFDEQDWSAGARYRHGASFSIGVGARELFHAQEHDALPPSLETPAPGFGTVHVVPDDANPEADYSSGLQEYTGDFKVRVPSYPAHVQGSARIYRRDGDEQMKYFYRSCSTHVCHTNSRTREIDTESQEYNLGFDSHLGPVDLVYNRNFLMFEDKAEDPVDFYGDFVMGRPVPGPYDHHVNPETSSYHDEVRLNTNLTNRATIAMSYIGGKSENEDSDITEKNTLFSADVSYTHSREHFFTVRYAWDNSEVDNISEASAAFREEIEDAVDPGETDNLGEISYRYAPRRGTSIHTHLRYLDTERTEWEESGFPESTTTWTADIDGKLKASASVDLEAELARDWTSDPALPTDFTDRWQFGLGALWTASENFTLLARYAGYLGSNDDDEALQTAYYDQLSPEEGLERDSDGHNILAVATWSALPSLNFVLSYSYARNDIDQDQLLGTPDTEGYAFLAESAPFESLNQTGRLDATWSASKRLQVTLGGTVITGEESWEPEVAGRPDVTAELAGIARTEFTKYLVDASAEYEFGNGLGITLACFYADYDDRENDLNDGSGGGVLAALSRKW